MGSDEDDLQPNQQNSSNKKRDPRIVSMMDSDIVNIGSGQGSCGSLPNLEDADNIDDPLSNPA